MRTCRPAILALAALLAAGCDRPTPPPTAPAGDAGATLRTADAPDAPAPVVEIRFADAAHVRASAGALRAASGVSLAPLQAALTRHGATDLRPLHVLPETALEALEGAAVSRGGRATGLASWHRATLPTGVAAAELAAALNALDVVDTAYVPGRPVPASALTTVPWSALAAVAPALTMSTTPDYSDRQEYLGPAPLGFDARYAWTLTGGRGRGVMVVDNEGDWLFAHEDLQLDPATTLLGGTRTGDAGAKDHGAAVLAMLVGRDNGYGVIGAVPDATPRVVASIFNNQFNSAAAITLAASKMRAGDVLVIELQVAGPTGKFVPLEWIPSVFDAVRAATGAGIVVVAAAGNGEQDLDDPALGGWFDRTHDSGAIIVGASEGDARGWPAPYTSYGSRVDVHGWGYRVTTAGYGDVWLGTAATPETRYTSSFGGTSAATPMGAAAAAAIQGRLKAIGRAPLSPTALRTLLVRSGTPQTSSTLSIHIGPLPNLRAAIALAPGGSGNAPPVIYTSSYFGGNEGTTITFTVSTYFDVDGDLPLTLRWSFGDGTSAVGAKVTHSYPDQGVFAGSVTATDTRGAVTVFPVRIGVSNARPYAHAGKDTAIATGGTYRFRGTFTDKGIYDAPWRYSVYFGDGTATVTGTLSSPTQAVLLNHTYAVDSTYQVRFKVWDKDNAVTTDYASVRVGAPNLAPTAVITGGPFTANEGDTVVISGATSSDPEGRPLTYTWSNSGQYTPVLTRIFDDNGTYTVRLIVTDDWKASDTATTTVTVANVAPTATLTAPTSIYEGSGYHVEIRGNDVSSTDLYNLSSALDCGLGAGYGSWRTGYGGGQFVDCPVLSDERAPITIRGKIRDKDGAERTYSRSMTVRNANPVVRLRVLTSAGAETQSLTVKAGTTVTFTGRFTDKGVNDAPWTYAMYWADGSPLETRRTISPGTTVTRTHRYSAVGIWKSYMNVWDVDGGVGKSLLMTITVTP